MKKMSKNHVRKTTPVISSKSTVSQQYDTKFYKDREEWFEIKSCNEGVICLPDTIIDAIGHMNGGLEVGDEYATVDDVMKSLELYLFATSRNQRLIPVNQKGEANGK